MDSSFLLYRELLQSLAVGKIIAYEDERYAKWPDSVWSYEPYIWSLKRWVCDEAIARIRMSEEGSVVETIQKFIQDLEKWSDEASHYTNILYFSIAAKEAEQILQIFQ